MTITTIERPTTYLDAKARQDALYGDLEAASAAIRAFPVGPMGLTPDHVKAAPAWMAAHRAYARKFGEVRDFNQWFTKKYRAQIKAARLARRSTVS